MNIAVFDVLMKIRVTKYIVGFSIEKYKIPINIIKFIETDLI